MSFGEYLRNIREHKRITINHLSELSGVSTSQLSRIETGHRGIPKPDTIKRIAPALGMKYEEMMMAAGYYEDKDIKDEWIKELLAAPIQQREAMRTIWTVIKTM